MPRAIDLVGRHWSGKHHAVVQGINLVSLLWTDGDRHIPCDYRIYHDAKKATKNDHFRDMIRAAHERGFRPRCVLFDGWYSSLENLKHAPRLRVDVAHTTEVATAWSIATDKGTRSLSRTEIAASGTEVWLPGYGLVKVFKIVAPDGDIAYWATNDLAMTDLTRQQYAEFSWPIENYHRGIKQCTEVERCQCPLGHRSAQPHRAWPCGRSCVWRFRFASGVSWLEAKTAIIRDAVRLYLAQPYIRLSTA